MKYFFLFSRREQLYTGGEVTDDEKMYTKWVEDNLTKEIWFSDSFFGSCVLKASVIECRSILSIDPRSRLGRHIGRHSVHWSTVGSMSLAWQRLREFPTYEVDTRPIVDHGVDVVLIECWPSLDRWLIEDIDRHSIVDAFSGISHLYPLALF